MIEIIKEAVLEAASIITNTENKHIEVKSSNHDLVTIYDRKIQEFLYERLSEAFPGH